MQRRIAMLAFGALIVLLGAVHPAAAQYFGRNKVQYEGFDFRILETPHFDIYYYPSEHDAVVDAARMAERWYARLSLTFHHEFRQRQVIVFYASHAHFAQTNIIPGFLDDGIGGLTDGLKGRIALPFAAGMGESDHVLGHELVHAFQRDILRQHGRSISMLPLWFIEGMAEYLSIGGVDPNTAMWLRDAAAENRLPRIDQLDDPRWFPYRYGQALWTFLAAQYGDDVVARSLESKASGAIVRMTSIAGTDARTLSERWQRWIRESWPADAAHWAGDPSTPVISPQRGDGRLNVGPALSPNGKELVFLSERDQYSINVFLADAVTGRITRRLIQTASDPHFDSLQFIESAGAWDPSGRKFVLAALSDGGPILTVLDVHSGNVEQEIRLDQLDQISSPAWSPDGHQLAFSALAGGVSDLYVLDIASKALRRLTNDAFADLQPAWSPDGGTIAFASDRFSSSLGALRFGNYRLGAVDLATGTIRELPTVAGAKNIDPHWSHDGQSIYFVADGGGISNVYRLDVASHAIFQVTDVCTGVSGITALSPALSVAGHTDRLAFSLYRHGAYELRTMDAHDGTPIVASSIVRPDPKALALGNLVAGPGAPDAGKDFTVKPYQHRLSLNGIGQPYLSAGGGSVGGFLRAGMSASFGDTLGNQDVRTAIQIGKTLDDFGTQVAYINRRARWNWGIAAAQVPWLTGGSRTLTSTGPGGATASRASVLLRQVHRQMSGLAIYPFSRVNRLELGAGVHDVSFDRRTTTDVFSMTTGRRLAETIDAGSAAPKVRLFETRAALVHDTALSGPTSPVLGERFRFEVAPTVGDLAFATVVADYRRYEMPVRPFTIAMRVQHVGRYGAGGGDPRLMPLVWTLRDLVRGYGDTAALTRTCDRTAEDDCAPLTYLSTRRFAVGNIELRFPPIGALRGAARYGPLPLETFVFADAGTFWSRRAAAHTATETSLRSFGGGARVNAAGFLFELDLVRPIDRPAIGWTFAFNVRPGF